MLPSTLKYLYSVEPVRMHFPAKHPCTNDTVCNAAILQGRWQHGERVGYCYPSGLEKTLCKWDIYVLLVKKRLSGVCWSLVTVVLGQFSVPSTGPIFKA